MKLSTTKHVTKQGVVKRNPIPKKQLWRNLGGKEYQLSTPKYDFIITHDPEMGWLLEIFNHKIKDPKAAYIDSIQGFDSLAEAKHDAENWK